MEPFRGIGNFDGKKRIGGHAHNEVPRREEPVDRYGRPLITVDGHQAQIACRLFCRDGFWPGWFEWAVGRPVPRRFQQEASRLAMLMGTGRGWPPVFQQRERVAPAVHVERVKTVTRLPPHMCSGGEITLTGCGPSLKDLSITCSIRREFVTEQVGDKEVFRAVDAPGCGKRFVLDKHGNRAEAWHGCREVYCCGNKQRDD